MSADAVKTDIHLPFSETNIILRYGIAFIAALFLQTVHTGAYNQFWGAAGAKRDGLKDGAYYTPVARLQIANRWARDAANAKRLWDWTEKELAVAG